MATLMQIKVLSNDYVKLALANTQIRENHSTNSFQFSQWRPPPTGWYGIKLILMQVFTRQAK